MLNNKIYQAVPSAGYAGGDKGGNVLVRDTREGEAEDLDPRLDLRNHSPTGFAWGYGGSGPAQLALAILADVLLKKEAGDTLAIRYHHDFKFDVIACLPNGEWTISAEFVRGWLNRRQSRARELRPGLEA